MFETILRDLADRSLPHREKLIALGMPTQRVTDMIKGRILPTEVHVVLIADAFQIDRHALQDEIALLRATPEQRTVLQRVMGKAKAGLSGATAAVLAGLLVFAASAGAGMADDARFVARLRRR